MRYAPESGRLRSLFTQRRRFVRNREIEPSFDSVPRTQAPDIRTRPNARYGLPGALLSDVFGPYAQSAAAELNASIEDDEDAFFEDSSDTGGLVARLSRALSAIESAVAPVVEKNSAAFPPPSAQCGAPAPVHNDAQRANEPSQVPKDNELLTGESSIDTSKRGAAASADRPRTARRDA